LSKNAKRKTKMPSKNVSRPVRLNCLEIYDKEKSRFGTAASLA